MNTITCKKVFLIVYRLINQGMECLHLQLNNRPLKKNIMAIENRDLPLLKNKKVIKKNWLKRYISKLQEKQNKQPAYKS